MLTVGNQKEWDDFENRHRLFFERFADLREAQSLAFTRTLISSSPRDLVIFSLGRLAVEDFQEILLLAGNGCGMGALKVLRGMYERVVTARYLHTAEDSEVENFLDYYWVQKNKNAIELNQTYGEDVLTQHGRSEEAQNLKNQYNNVREKFLVTDCKKCGTKRLNYSWSKLSLIAMADRIGEGIRNLAYEAYYLPLQQAHSTIASIHTRFKIEENDSITFKEGPHRTESDDALRISHFLLLNVLALQKEYFHLDEMKEPLDRSWSSYNEIWTKSDLEPSGED